MNKPKVFGIRTEGTELAFEELIKECSQKFPNYFCFVELGTAQAISFKAFSEILAESRPNQETILVTVDIPSGFAGEYREVIKNFPSDLLIIDASGLTKKQKVTPSKNVPQLILSDSAKLFAENWDTPISFCFIDANHNKQSVVKDFLAIEKHIIVGGTVTFHDYGSVEQGTDPQIGGGFIEVREACRELGLTDNVRPNWKFIKEIRGSRYEGGDGNSIGVFERI